MKPTHLLTRDEFSACFAEPMQDVTASAEAAVDVWPYVDAIVMLLGIKVYDVVSDYRSADGQLEHVLIGTNRTSFFSSSSSILQHEKCTATIYLIWSPDIVFRSILWKW